MYLDRKKWNSFEKVYSYHTLESKYRLSCQNIKQMKTFSMYMLKVAVVAQLIFFLKKLDVFGCVHTE